MLRTILFAAIGMMIFAFISPTDTVAQDWVQMCNSGFMGLQHSLSDPQPYDVVLIQDTAYMTRATSSSDQLLRIFVGDAAAPSVLFSRPLAGGPARGLVIDGGDAFVGTNSYLSVIALTDTLPTRDSVQTAGTAWDVAIGGENGDYAFVAVGSAGLQTVNVADRDDIASVDTLNLDIDSFTVEARAVHAEGATAYVAGGGGIPSYTGYATYHIIDVFFSDSPTVAAEWITKPSTFGVTQEALDIKVKGDHAYLAVDDNHVFVFSNVPYYDAVADTSCYPCYLRTLTTSGSAKGLDIQGDYLYVAAQAAGNMDVFYLGDPTNPQLVGHYSLGHGSSEHLGVLNDRIVATIGKVSSDTGGLLILCQEFSRGDVDDDGAIDDDDVDDLLSYVFYSSPVPQPGEWNGDVRDVSGVCDKDNPTVNSADVIYLNNFVNNGGAAPDCSVVPCENCE